MSYQPIVIQPSASFLAEMHEIQMANLHREMTPEDGYDHSNEISDDELSHLDYDAIKNDEQINPFVEQY